MVVLRQHAQLAAFQDMQLFGCDVALEHIGMIAESEIRHLDSIFTVLLCDPHVARIADIREPRVQRAHQAIQSQAGETQQTHRFGTDTALQEAEFAIAADAFEPAKQFTVRQGRA